MKVKVIITNNYTREKTFTTTNCSKKTIINDILNSLKKRENIVLGEEESVTTIIPAELSRQIMFTIMEI